MHWDWMYDLLLVAYSLMWFFFGRVSGIHTARKLQHRIVLPPPWASGMSDPAYPFSMREGAEYDPDEEDKPE